MFRINLVSNGKRRTESHGNVFHSHCTMTNQMKGLRTIIQLKVDFKLFISSMFIHIPESTLCMGTHIVTAHRRHLPHPCRTLIGVDEWEHATQLYSCLGVFMNRFFRPNFPGLRLHKKLIDFTASLDRNKTKETVY